MATVEQYRLDIKNQKIWIQHDGTEVGVASELVALGVPKGSRALGSDRRSVRDVRPPRSSRPRRSGRKFHHYLVHHYLPKEDIVLAFHAPFKRKYTGFAEG